MKSEQIQSEQIKIAIHGLSFLSLFTLFLVLAILNLLFFSNGLFSASLLTYLLTCVAARKVNKLVDKNWSRETPRKKKRHRPIMILFAYITSLAFFSEGFRETVASVFI